MKGVIFAAGLGTRLYPLTKDKPKALVEVLGRTMLEHTLDAFETAGITDAVVNVHAFADQVEDSLAVWATKHPSAAVCVSDERALLLETGGGLKQMQPWLIDSPFLVHNVDVLSRIDLNALMAADERFSAASGLTVPRHIGTLAVRRSESDRYFLFNREGLLCGWENVKTGEVKHSRPDETGLERWSFTGVHVLHPVLFELMTETGVFSITDVYLRLATHHTIRLYDTTDQAWFDIGTPQQLAAVEACWQQR